ncbi:MAG: hypothetical protein HY079_10080, partial [Elusimicrobia bacterium]|nr:hypothetical protein [Elusimicrobiota bacterium]
MKSSTLAACLLLSAAWAASAAEPSADSYQEPEKPAVKIKPKGHFSRHSGSEGGSGSEEGGLLQPDVSLIDTPTTAVLDYGGYSSQTRFFSRGGVLAYVSFGVFQSLNLGGSLTVDGLVGDDRTVRLRAPDVQVKYRFYDGDRVVPSFALGFDGQGYDYNQVD